MKTALRRIAALSLASLVAVGLVACSGNTTSQSPASTPPAATHTSTSTPTPEQIQGTLIEAPQSGITFIVPKGWQPLDLAQLKDIPSSEWPTALEKMADAAGLDLETFISYFASMVEVVVVSDKDDEFVDNISVLPTPVSQLPSDDSLLSETTELGWTDVSIDRPKLAAGEAIVVNSKMVMDGTAVHRRSMIINTGNPQKGAVITVSARTDASASEIAELIIKSLEITN